MGRGAQRVLLVSRFIDKMSVMSDVLIEIDNLNRSTLEYLCTLNKTGHEITPNMHLNSRSI